jgi:hypothetical protein
MKHFQPHHLPNWKDTNIPAPFPGKYPTRVCYHVCFVGDTAEVYIGKPNLIAVKKYLAAKRRPDVEWWQESEFDRANLLTRRCSGRSLTKTHSTLAKLYHPFRTVDGIGAFAAPFWRKRISGFTCYSPFETLKLQMVKDHKAWLVASGIVKGKEIPQAKVDEAGAGIWQCTDCLWYNNGERVRCRSCNRPKPGIIIPPPIAVDPAPPRPMASWVCPTCAYQNLMHWRDCRNCDSPRPNGLPRT